MPIIGIKTGSIQDIVAFGGDKSELLTLLRRIKEVEKIDSREREEVLPILKRKLQRG
jgi:hypothetical protein